MMSHRTRTASRQRRVTAVAMGVSIAVHAALLAFLRLGVPATPAGDGARAAPDEDRYVRQRPLQVVRLAPAPRAAAPETGAPAEASASRRPADGNAGPSPRLSASASALYLRPVTAGGGGLEDVVFASATAGAAGSGADLNGGVDFEAASRAAKDASREGGRDRRGGRGSGIGITILGPGGGGSCDPSVLPGGGSIPTGIVDDFTGRSGGGIRIGGDRSRIGGDGIRIGGGARPLSGGGIRIGGGRRF